MSHNKVNINETISFDGGSEIGVAERFVFSKTSLAYQKGLVHEYRDAIEFLQAQRINRSSIKRLVDIALSLCFLLFIGSWFFTILSLLIIFSTGASPFFTQYRRGKGGKLFYCFKFRTMVHSSTDVDEYGKYNQATHDDPRITKLGKVLRKYSIDELPQLLNILLGHMSLVGPRPHPEPLNQDTEQRLPYYNKRHLIRPGLTGLAQIKGFRGHTMHDFERMEKRVMYDLLYIRKWKVTLDIRILFATILNHPMGI